jgi:hypothetical protein
LTAPPSGGGAERSHSADEDDCKSKRLIARSVEKFSAHPNSWDNWERKMSRFRWKLMPGVVAVAAAVSLGAKAGHAQLQVTEIMSDPLNEDAWEWIEVRNLGASSVNLDGYIIDRIGDPSSTATTVNSANALNTIIPAGGVAVLYDGDLTGPGDYNDDAFRSAWGLAPSAPLIALPNFGNALTNGGGTAVGFWADANAYNADVADDGLGVLRVASLSNAAFGLDFRTASGFPSMTNGVSATWNGAGNYQDGANWAASQVGVGGAAASVSVNLPGAPLNSTNDTANPGKVPAGAAAAGLLISEIMYDPNSAAVSSVERWEWVEIYNNTGATINFGTTPYYLHDDDGADLAAANVATGVVPAGSTAVLFNDTLTTQQMIDAWDPGGVLGTVFIPVSSFPAFANGGDAVALWDTAADYNLDSTGDSPRSLANAVVSVVYDDEGSATTPTGWPDAQGRSSIYLTSLTADPTVPSSWIDSFVGDGLSAAASQVFADTIVHAGGDVGSPGSFGTATPTIDADFNNDNIVDGADFLIWQRGFGTGTTNGTGDADGNGVVNTADLTAWKSTFGSAPAAAAGGAVPEPAATGLCIMAAAGLAFGRRRAK